MSVPSWERTESKLEFLSNFNKMRKNAIQILMRDFGIKRRSYSVHLIEKIYNIQNEDKIILENLMNKYQISSADVDKYPNWIMDNWRNEILKILNLIGIELRLFNSIYINSNTSTSCELEYMERRKHISLAIGYCNSLLDKLQEIISSINVPLGAYEELASQTEYEIKLLKGVRKADNKLYKNLKASIN